MLVVGLPASGGLGRFVFLNVLVTLDSGVCFVLVGDVVDPEPLPDGQPMRAGVGRVSDEPVDAVLDRLRAGSLTQPAGEVPTGPALLNLIGECGRLLASQSRQVAGEISGQPVLDGLLLLGHRLTLGDPAHAGQMAGVVDFPTTTLGRWLLLETGRAHVGFLPRLD